MATSENPFPEKLKQNKQSYVSGIKKSVVGSSHSNQPPLYYDDTINASLVRSTEQDMLFDSSHELSSARSGLTGSSSQTFRDTQIDTL